MVSVDMMSCVAIAYSKISCDVVVCFYYMELYHLTLYYMMWITYCHIVPGTLSYDIVAYDTIHNMLHPLRSLHIMSCHIIGYHVILYDTILRYHTMIPHRDVI